MHPAAGTGYEIVGPLEAFNNPIDGKGKELSIIGRQWKIVIQGRNSKVFIDLKFLSNNWLDFQPLKNILIRGSGVRLIEIGIIIRISRADIATLRGLSIEIIRAKQLVNVEYCLPGKPFRISELMGRMNTMIASPPYPAGIELVACPLLVIYNHPFAILFPMRSPTLGASRERTMASPAAKRTTYYIYS
ncbi:hypothetical protein V6N12_076363 [Hibiscus sabdariffa]|uniref:Uncharacterized protein n=1 Tax=Hibiscus sabdariffa TaxID=183260 RepID=A0ABR2D9L0_9ROSI